MYVYKYEDLEKYLLNACRYFVYHPPLDLKSVKTIKEDKDMGNRDTIIFKFGDVRSSKKLLNKIGFKCKTSNTNLKFNLKAFLAGFLINFVDAFICEAMFWKINDSVFGNSINYRQFLRYNIISGREGGISDDEFCSNYELPINPTNII